ncbi:unnamed protein product [Echinostoma caproni]|uniref:EXS domain-containing protein n=1 Tax=Echinostoma caproni TaxID=27848 RepID=A0A183A079_9TREM|nr:unnamed protein product [Echinostoma caproni]
MVKHQSIDVGDCFRIFPPVSRLSTHAVVVLALCLSRCIVTLGYPSEYSVATYIFVSVFVFTIEWDWAYREAYLELERRRRDGLPLIDRDLVPASRVKLPTDEELGPDFKIII